MIFSIFRAIFFYFAMSSENVTLTQMASSEIGDINSILNEKMFLQTYFSLNKIYKCVFHIFYAVFKLREIVKY